ncbi:MAG: hypothetical protein ABH832_01075 [bacterium]
MKLNTPKKAAIAVGALVVVVIAIITFVIIPTALNIIKITDDTQNIRLYLEKKNEQTLRSRVTKKKIEEVDQQSSSFVTHQFFAQDALQLIQLLENIASQNKVEQKIIGSNLDKIGSENSVSINLSILGSYLDIINYIHDIETSDYFINIDKLQLSQHVGDSKYVNATVMNLSLRLYVSKK